MKLSERLGQEWERASSFAHWVGRDPTRGPDEAASWRELAKTLREAAALAKRYEDAPVAKAAYYYRPTMGAATGIMFEGPDFTPLAGQRVRIVLDKEG